MSPNYKLTGPKGGTIVKRAKFDRVKLILPGLVKRFGKVAVTANAAPIAGKKIPVHVPPPVPSVRLRMVAWAHWGVDHRASFVYDETVGRSKMFHRKPGDASTPIHADCSQFYAAICHWVGIASTTDTDYTGTLLQKGKKVTAPKPGDCAIFGPGTGAHAVMVTEPAGDKDWWCIGFGHQGAPDRVLLSVLETYFNLHKQPRVRFLAFTP